MIFGTNCKVEGFFTIKDKDTQEILVDKCNAIHFGNLAASMAESLSGEAEGHIQYMAFGNGGTSIDASGKITYKEPNISNFYDSSAALYNETFYKEIDQTTDNSVTAIPSTSSYSDIKVKVTLDFIDTGSEQDVIDRADNMDEETVFDELAVYTGLAGIVPPTTLANSNNALLVTHVIFHPVQKSANRILEIDYTIRIHLQ